MSDFVFNRAKGAAAELCRNYTGALIMALYKAVGNVSTLRDADNLSAVAAVAATTELTDGSYARKTGLTETVTLDDTNDRVDLDVPDQTWSALAGSAVVGVVIAIESSASDSARIPLTQQDFAVTPDASDVTLQVNASGFYRAS